MIRHNKIAVFCEGMGQICLLHLGVMQGMVGIFVSCARIVKQVVMR